MDEAAANRVPWLSEIWDAFDLQIDQRSGRISSSLTESGVLRLRAGEHFRLAVVFFDSNGQATDPQPDFIRWTLREQSNLDLVASAIKEFPVPENAGNPYFILEPNAAHFALAAEDLRQDQELLCVCDIEWMIDGKIYSSRTLPVRVEFGFTLQKPAYASAPAPVAAEALELTTPPALPPQLPSEPDQAPSESEIRAWFDEWLEDTGLPAGPPGPPGPTGPPGAITASEILVTICTPSGPQTITMFKK